MVTSEATGSGAGAPKQRRLRAEERREMIARAALKLFAERGYERTTTKEIARAAGISEGTIFRYFPTKHDLLLAFFSREVFAPLSEIFKIEEPIDDYRILRAFVADRFRLWQRHRNLMKVIIGEAIFNPEMVAHLNRLTAPAQEIVEEYFRRRIRDGAFRELDVNVASRALLSYMLTYFFRWVLLDTHEGDESSQSNVIDELTGLFLNGVMR